MTGEDYVSFETAKLLKEKGFDEYGMYFYTLKDEGREGYKSNKRLGELAHNSNPDLKERAVSCPTLQMAMKWLREVHNLDIIVPPQFDNSKWTYSAIIFKLSIPCTEIRLNDNKDKKEEACEEAIKYCLENLI